MPKKRTYFIEYYQRKDKKWEWRIVAPNGNIIASSAGQGYERKYCAVRGFNAIKDALSDNRLQIRYVTK